MGEGQGEKNETTRAFDPGRDESPRQKPDAHWWSFTQEMILGMGMR